MRYTQHHLRSAPIAIAAMLALGISPGIAQTAQPPEPTGAAEPIVLQLPVDAPAEEPAPAPGATAVSTSPTPEPTTVSKPVVQPVPPPPIALDLPAAEAEAEEPAAAATQTAQNTTAAEPVEAVAAREPAPAPAPETRSVTAADAASDSPAVTSAETEEAPVAAPLPVSEPAPVAAAEMTNPEPIAGPDWIAFIALALAGLIPLTLAFLAFAWFRRRSHRVSRHETVALETQAEDDPATPVAEPEPPVEREPAPAHKSPLESYQGLPNGGGAVTLPTAIPETFEERDALLKRMIAAEPDRANPFRSTKARAKRARLILQSLGRKFDDEKPRIDLSEYTANGPAYA